MDKLRACLVDPSCIEDHQRRTREFRQLLATWIPVTGRFLLAKKMGFDICVWYCFNNTTNKNISTFLKDRQEE